MKMRTAEMAARMAQPHLKLAACLYLIAIVAIAPAILAQTQPTAQSETPAPIPDQALTLDPFVVGASSNVGYGAETTSSLGTVQAYADVPQTINVVTSEAMHDFDINDSRAAMGMVPGVQIGGLINDGTNMIRGIVSNAFYVDGMQQATTNTISASNLTGSFVMPIEFYDRIEVVKGPSSADFAIGEAGGAINFVSKIPADIERTDVTLGFGEYNNYKFTIDTQGVKGNLSYRLIVDQEAGGSEVKWLRSAATGAQLALKYKLDPKTTIVSITSIEKNISPSYGIPNYLVDLPGAQSIGLLPVPGVAYNPASPPASSLPYGFLNPDNTSPNTSWNEDTALYFRSYLSLIHKFNDQLSIRNTTMIDNIVQDARVNTPANSNTPAFNKPAPGEYGYQPVILDFANNTHGLADDLTIAASSDLLGGHWETTAGADFHQEESNQAISVDVPSIFYNIYDPGSIGSIDKYITMPATPNAGWQEENNHGFGFYGQEQVSFLNGKVTILGGWRKDFLDENTINHLANDTVTSTGMQHTEGAPRIALTIKPLPWLSLYSLYSVHKDPAQQTTLWTWFGVSPPPTSLVPNPYAKLSYTPEATLLEDGAKASLLGGKLLASIAIYHDITQGTIITPFQGTGYTDSAGNHSNYIKSETTGENVHGVEASITGVVNDRLQFQVGYSYCRGSEPSLVGETNPAILGNVLVNNLVHPADQIMFHGKYDFGDLKGNGLYATYGIDFYGPFPYYYTQATNWQTDWNGVPYTVWSKSWQYEMDAGVGYRWAHGRQKVTLSATNLTDRFVDLGSEASGNNSVIFGRTVWIKYSLSY
jgi:outer-membrane receptor for ferric coprogen and ferric-rhodotorulic acid